MGEPLTIKAGFVPYSDGSGFGVDVVIRKEYEGADPAISINTSYQVEVSRWPEIRDGIEKLLKAV